MHTCHQCWISWIGPTCTRFKTITLNYQGNTFGRHRKFLRSTSSYQIKDLALLRRELSANQMPNKLTKNIRVNDWIGNTWSILSSSNDQVVSYFKEHGGHSAHINYWRRENGRTTILWKSSRVTDCLFDEDIQYWEGWGCAGSGTIEFFGIVSRTCLGDFCHRSMMQ